MAKIVLPKRSGKRSKVREKSGNFEKDIEWQPCFNVHYCNMAAPRCLDEGNEHCNN